VKKYKLLKKKIEMNLERKYVCIVSMPMTYQQNKKHIMKWRENNPDEWRKSNQKTRMKCYHWKKIKMEFLNILIDDFVETSSQQ
jgi:hypothetical protein